MSQEAIGPVGGSSNRRENAIVPTPSIQSRVRQWARFRTHRRATELSLGHEQYDETQAVRTSEPNECGGGIFGRRSRVLSSDQRQECGSFTGDQRQRRSAEVSAVTRRTCSFPLSPWLSTNTNIEVICYRGRRRNTIDLNVAQASVVS